MIRTLTLAALAAALLASPAAAQSVRISTAGKTPEQLHADITAAARKVCLHQVSMGVTFPQEEMARCVKSTVASTVSQAKDPALTEVAAKIRLAQR